MNTPVVHISSYIIKIALSVQANM